VIKIEDKNITGFTLKMTKEKVIIEMPISNLIRGFNASPNNYSECKIKQGHREEFAKWLIENLIDEADSESGDCYIVKMLDEVYERAYEEYFDFVKYPEDEDE
jgi:hypothetical protein